MRDSFIAANQARIKGEVIAFEKEKLSDVTSPLTPLLKKGEGNKSGFTLQETLIALTILGVVAAIAIPSLIQKYIEATSRVKVKKAMAAYEKAVNQMVLENNIAGQLNFGQVQTVVKQENILK